MIAMNTYDLDTKEGWLYAAGLAGSLGWRDGEGDSKPLTATELLRAILVNVNLVHVRVGYKRHLRGAYGAAYCAAGAKRYLKGEASRV